MHRVIFDTDVLLDALDPKRPESDEVCQALEKCSGYSGTGIFGMACALSLKDVYCVFSRMHDAQAAREAIRHITKLLAIVPTSAEECLMALDLNEPDFENAIVRAAAELNDADFIITRNKAAYGTSKVRSVTAYEFIQIVA